MITYGWFMTLLYAMSKTLHDAIIPQKPGSGHPVPGLSPCEGPSRPRTSRATSPVRFASCGSTSIRAATWNCRANCELVSFAKQGEFPWWIILDYTNYM